VGIGALGAAAIGLALVPVWQPARSGAAPWDRQGRWPALAALAGLLVAAAALRLYRLDAGLWHDEILTDVLYVRMPLGYIVSTFESENQHFLYSILAHLSVTAFGHTSWALRLPAAVFGVASIWALYLLGREVAGRTEGLLAAGLLTFSYTHVWFSQNARGYSALLCFTILSSWLLLRALRLGGRQAWLWYSIAAALGVYAHITMAFVVIGQFGVYVAASLRRRDTRWWEGLFVGFGMAGLLTFTLHALVLPQLLHGMGREESVVEAWKSPLWTVLEVAKGLQLSFAGGVVAIGALVVFVVGLGSFARSRPAMLGLLLVPPLLGAAVVVGLGHHLWPRFFLFAVGFGALVAVRGGLDLVRLAGRLAGVDERPARLAGAALCVGLMAVSATSIRYAYAPKQDFAGAAQFVEASRRPGDAVAVAGLATFTYRNYYATVWSDVSVAAALDGLRARAARTWIVYTFPPVLEAVNPDIAASVQRDFELVRQFPGTVGGGTIYVYRHDAATARSADRSE
jgi:4-amino-4-deoxy-L-arabinose transferase-like glycosyltransferase